MAVWKLLGQCVCMCAVASSDFHLHTVSIWEVGAVFEVQASVITCNHSAGREFSTALHQRCGWLPWVNNPRCGHVWQTSTSSLGMQAQHLQTDGAPEESKPGGGRAAAAVASQSARQPPRCVCDWHFAPACSPHNAAATAAPSLKSRHGLHVGSCGAGLVAGT